MITQKLSYEAAKAEVDSFLNARYCTPHKREKNESSIEELIEALMYGRAVINGNGTLSQILIYPILDENGETALGQLNYVGRMTVGAIGDKAATLPKNATPQAAQVAVAAAYTNQSTAMIEKLDLADYTLTQTILVFL